MYDFSGHRTTCFFIPIFFPFDRTLSNWLLEFEKWTPSIIVVSYKVRLMLVLLYNLHILKVIAVK